MTLWEYASILVDEPAAKPVLDDLGAQGWELVSVVQGNTSSKLLYVFKRPKQADPVLSAGTLPGSV